MSGRRANTLAACLLAAGPAAAELPLLCVFDIECYETESCQATAYGMDILLADGDAPFPVVAETEAETLSGVGYEIENGYLLHLSSSVGPVMITIHADGSARQSVHQSGHAGMVNYTGGCGEAE